MKDRGQKERVRKLVEKLVQAYAPEKVILFGSHARGDPRESSDIDLLIIKQTSARFLDRWIDVRRILSDPTRETPLDTLVLTPEEVSARLAAGDQFLEEIMTRGQILYAA